MTEAGGRERRGSRGAGAGPGPRPERRDARSWRAALGPAAAVVVATAAGFAATRFAPSAVATWTAVPYALVLALGPGFAYAAARSAGASAGWATAAGLAAPLLWLAKEMHRVAAVFGPAETLFYAFNPLSAGVFVFAGLQMAVVELALRRRRTGRWRLVSGPGAVVAGVATLAALAFAFGRGNGGREIFYGYVALYRWLFGAA